MFFLLITLILLIIIVLSLATWAYFRTFFNQKKHSDIHRLPTGEQYEPYNSVMKDLMDEMENIIGENVTIRSFDKKNYMAYTIMFPTTHRFTSNFTDTKETISETSAVETSLLEIWDTTPS